MVLKNCANSDCNKEFSVRPSSKKKYCSHECYSRTMIGKMPDYPGTNPNLQITIICCSCNKQFKLPPNKVERSEHLYCSRTCASLASRKKPDIDKRNLIDLYQIQKQSLTQIAKTFNTGVWVIKRLLQESKIELRERNEWGKASWSQADDNRKQASSRSGTRNMEKLNQSMSAEEKHKRVVNAALARQNKHGPTSIERKMMEALNQSGIAYQFQFPIGDKFLCDFAILHANLIVECDGIYWHSTPKAKARDNSKDAYLKKCGYKVIRFTDIEIKENIHACVDKIKELFT